MHGSAKMPIKRTAEMLCLRADILPSASAPKKMEFRKSVVIAISTSIPRIGI